MSNRRLLLAMLAIATPGALLAVDRGATRAAAANPVKHGVDLWQAGDFDGAVKAWRPAADGGDADAQFDLAQAYKLGRGVAKDLPQAESWYRRAAQQGHDQAQATLGLIMFQDGDRAGAMPWLRQAADKGEPRAQYVYGTALFNGDVVAKDWPRAYAMMTRAAAAGLPQAKTSLAQMDQFMPMAQRQQGTALAAAGTTPPAAAATTDAPPAPRPSAPAAYAPPGPAAAANAPPPIRTAPLPPSRAPESTYATETATSPAVAAPAPAPMRAPPAPRVDSAPRPVPAPRAAPPAPAPVRTAAPAAGGWRIQLGAFGTQGGAETQWRMLSGRAAPLRRLQPFYVKAGAVTRLQAGPFPTRAAASEACRAVGATCFPVGS